MKKEVRQSMSHVDDGTLHAYLDGELSPVEVERLDTHVAGCSVCRARLDKERALIDRAARLLGMAVPLGPERVAPPLHQLERRRPTWSRLRVPLAWAATIVVAVGLGYYAGFSGSAQLKDAAPAAAQPMIATTESPPAGPASGVTDTRFSVRPTAPADEEQRAATPAATSGRIADRVARAEADQPRQAAEQAEPSRGQGQREARAAAAPAPASVPLDRARADLAANDAAAVGAVALAGARMTWPVIQPESARNLLGATPVTIPGYAVRALRRHPTSREIVVEQELSQGVVVSLFESARELTQGLEEAPSMVIDGRQSSRDSAVAKAARRNERLARFVGGLRVEISGPLPMDSLSRLLESVRP